MATKIQHVCILKCIKTTGHSVIIVFHDEANLVTVDSLLGKMSIQNKIKIQLVFKIDFYSANNWFDIIW